MLESYKNAFGDNTVLRRLFRFLKEKVLELKYGKRGMPKRINGRTFRILPRHRHIISGQYDEAVAGFLRERILPGSVCLNIGANVGLYALQFACWTGPAGRVIAFEPAPESARDLRRHAAMNGFSNLITVVEKAVSDKPGRADFFTCGTDQMNRLGQPNPLVSETRAIPIAVTTLDLFCRDENLKPDWILIDVEGFEIAALKGAVEVIRQAGPKLGLVVEMHPNTWEIAQTSRKDLEQILDDLRLEPVALNGQEDCLAEYGMAWLKSV